jgi:hypothetical protein
MLHTAATPDAEGSVGVAAAPVVVQSLAMLALVVSCYIISTHQLVVFGYKESKHDVHTLLARWTLCSSVVEEG